VGCWRGGWPLYLIADARGHYVAQGRGRKRARVRSRASPYAAALVKSMEVGIATEDRVLAGGIVDVLVTLGAEAV